MLLKSCWSMHLSFAGDIRQDEAHTMRWQAEKLAPLRANPFNRNPAARLSRDWAPRLADGWLVRIQR
jgi:hypothetical protein